MEKQNFRLLKLLIVMTALLLLTSCTAGGTQFTHDHPAGFWYGFWHGIIAFISLIIQIINENVAVYETNNSGGWYDFGFLLGVIFVWGGSSHVTCKSAANKKCEKEWNEIGDKVEKKVMRKLNEWAESEDGKEWEEIGEKVEKKLKRKIREWAEKD